MQWLRRNLSDLRLLAVQGAVFLAASAALAYVTGAPLAYMLFFLGIGAIVLSVLSASNDPNPLGAKSRTIRWPSRTARRRGHRCGSPGWRSSLAGWSSACAQRYWA